METYNNLFDALSNEFNIINSMNLINKIESDIQSIRKTYRIPNSYPLPALELFLGDNEGAIFRKMFYAGHLKVLEDSTKIGRIYYGPNSSDLRARHGLTDRIKLDFKKAGPYFGKNMKKIISAINSGDYKISDGILLAGDIPISHEFYYVSTEEGENTLADTKVMGDTSFMVLDVSLGYGVEEYIINLAAKSINSSRKDMGCGVKDKVNTFLYVPVRYLDHCINNEDEISRRTRSESLEIIEHLDDNFFSKVFPPTPA